MTTSTPRTDDPTRAVHDPSLPFRLTADDLFGDLLWTKLLRVPRLALRPGRIGLGVAAVLVIALLDHLLAMIAGGQPVLGGLGRSLSSAGSLEIAAETLHSISGWRSITVLVFSGLLIAILSVGVGRMTAEEFARGRFPHWTEGLAWCLRFAGAAVLAHAIPLVIVVLIVLGLGVAGLALLSVPGVNVLGAVLGVIAVAAGAAALLVVVVYALGFGLFAPAIAAEGTDGIDAMQRIFAYVIGQPLRLLLYAAVLTAQFAILVSLLVLFAEAAAALASSSLGLFLDGKAALIASGIGTDEMTGAGRVAASIMGTVLQLPLLLVAGYAVAYWICGWTVQYLLLRRANDGQDVTDIYVPGEVQRRVDEVMARRASAADPAD